MAEKKRKFSINPYLLVILSFAVIIAIGSVLLTMPFTQTSGQWCPYIDALTTAVSATCVTGIATYVDGAGDTLTFWGEFIVMIMVQIGGLGFITVLTFIITLFKTRIQFKNRYLISQMVGSTSYADVIKFVRKIILISFIFEFAGFLMGLPVFFTIFRDDVGNALWYSLFHSISSFNNAGFDLFEGTTSLIRDDVGLLSKIPLWMHYYLCAYLMLMIIFGGISFLTIIEVCTSKKKPTQWRAFTKIVLVCTITLILLGSLALFLTDGMKQDHPMTYFECLFQAVSCRTAGFLNYSQDEITLPGKLICCLLMLIGGAPLSTAGGIKITTLFMVLLAMSCYFRGKKVTAFKRTYSNNMVLKAMSLIFIAILIIFVAFIAISEFGFAEGYTYGEGPLALKSNETTAYLFEICSCFGTTGFFLGIEPYLSTGSKVVLCLLMFLGRLGPMTFFSLFQKNMDKDDTSKFTYVEEDFLIG